MVLKARRNLRGFSFGRFIEVQSCSFEKIKVETPVFILTNPPYDQRLEADVDSLYEGIGNWLKHDLTESTTWIISASEEGLKSVGLKPSKKYKVFNGSRMRIQKL